MWAMIPMFLNLSNVILAITKTYNVQTPYWPLPYGGHRPSSSKRRRGHWSNREVRQRGDLPSFFRCDYERSRRSSGSQAYSDGHAKLRAAPDTSHRRYGVI